MLHGLHDGGQLQLGALGWVQAACSHAKPLLGVILGSCSQLHRALVLIEFLLFGCILLIELHLRAALDEATFFKFL